MAVTIALRALALRRGTVTPKCIFLLESSNVYFMLMAIVSNLCSVTVETRLLKKLGK